MKRTLTGLGIVLLFSFMLLSPKAVFSGASSGLLLWFQTILPTLFPFLLVSNLLLATGSIHYLTSAFSKICRTFLSVSDCGSFAVITGFLCGYPMGAKTASDLLDAQKISRSEASYLLSFCNNTSPAFILSYVVIQNLKKDSISIPFLLILTLTPLMMSFVFRLFYRAKDHIHPFSHMMQVSSSTASQSENLSANYFDRCIMNAFESITKVGGYMMMFSVLIQLLASALPDNTASLLLYSSLEISTGIRRLASSALYTSHKIILCAALTSFGGWCCIAQTYSMISGNHLPILPYIAENWPPHW